MKEFTDNQKFLLTIAHSKERTENFFRNFMEEKYRNKIKCGIWFLLGLISGMFIFIFQDIY